MRNLALLLMLTACATSGPERVTLQPEGVVAAADSGSPFAYESLAEAVFGGEALAENAQAYSLYGREDLIAGDHRDYQARACDAAPGDPVAVIAAAAADTRVVIVNEAHSRSETRTLIEDLTVALRPLGYDHFAAETFSNSPERERVEARADEPYLRDEDGYYLREAAFGRLLRTVKGLGYELVPYEDTTPLEDIPSDPAEMINQRDAGQAAYLTERVLSDPDAKVLVHVGYSHANERPMAYGEAELLWLAARLKRDTGIDPLTVSQTKCLGNAAGRRLSVPATPAEERGFDLYVDLPPARFVRSRPAWRLERGDRTVDIPQGLLPTEGAHVVEARFTDEPDEAIPVDRVLVRPGEDVALMLPPGTYRVRAVALSEPEAD